MIREKSQSMALYLLFFIFIIIIIFKSKIIDKVFENFVEISLEKNRRSDQLKYWHVPQLPGLELQNFSGDWCMI